MISISELSNWALLGLIIKSPSILATRTSEIGYSNGISESWITVEAASPASESGITSSSCDISWIITCVSWW